jgi:hypothetical protein
VQVRAGGVAGGADDADGLAGGHLLPDGDGGSVEQVAVAGGDRTGVSDLGVPAFSALRISARRAGGIWWPRHGAGGGCCG